jgi:hypothetical protein
MRPLLCLLFVFSLSVQLSAQSFSFSGYVRDVETGEELIGASVYSTELGKGTSTNAYGYFVMELPQGSHEIEVQFIGFSKKTVKIDLKEDLRMDFELASEGFQIDEVVVTDEKGDENVRKVEMSTTKLSIKEVQKIPQLLGEVDIIRSIQLLPGVSTVGEGASGFNVRGGKVDQNLILLDEAPVYNSSHLFGFFSVFNSDAVKDVKLYKGGIPAIYGGRLSSVLDVRQKEGNDRRFSGQGGLGVLSSRITLESPIVKERSSIMVAARRSYADLFLAFSNDPAINSNTAYFYDFNAKVNYRVGDNDRLFLSGYWGRDVFRFGELFGFDWGNKNVSLRWNHLFSEKIFSNFTFLVSDYDYALGIPEGENAFEWRSRIMNMDAKADFSWYVNGSNTLSFGFSVLNYNFHPGSIKPGEDVEVFNAFTLPQKHAVEPAVYVQNEHKINARLSLIYGIRLSSFYRLGPEDIRTYEDGQPLSEATVLDTIRYEKNSIISSFYGLEPRFAATYLLTERNSIKFSYNRMRQYIHLVSNTTAATPVDVWTPSGPHVQPATADQVAFGYFENYRNNTYELSAEVYYKVTREVQDYKDGADLIANAYLETELLSGEGRAYGLELMVQKKKGKLSGWLSYTLSRSEQRVVGDHPEETLNNGDWYRTNWDKTHDISVVLSYMFNELWMVGGSFAFQTGRPITYPDGKFLQDGILIPIYSNRNGARVPNYHRLDVSATFTPRKKKEESNFEQSITFGAYNAYGRRNAYSVFFRQNADDPTQTEIVQLSVFGTIIPFVTWNFKF